MSDKEVQQQKDIQYFGAVVNAWVNWSLELDKSLLTLSAGAIGLCVTLLATKVGTESLVLLFLYLGAMTAFLVCVVGVLVGIHKSKHFLGQVAKEQSADEMKPVKAVLEVADAVARWSFGIGAGLLTIIGFWTAVLLYLEKGAQVSNDRTNTRIESTGLGKSLSGIENLRPTSGTPASTPAQGTGPASQPAGSTPAQSTQTPASGTSSGTK